MFIKRVVIKSRFTTDIYNRCILIELMRFYCNSHVFIAPLAISRYNAANSILLKEGLRYFMDLIHYLIDFVLNLNVHMNTLVNTFGLWTYALLFLIIFCETGLVIMPFLPGDSLLFAVGIITATTNLNVHLMVFVLAFAAILGDNVNYWVGHLFGEKLFKPDAKILKTSHLEKTHQFFEKYGAKAIIIARFVPIIRTFTPFAAGMGEMPYRRFITLSVIAAFIWVGSITYLGYFFSNIPFMQENFSYLVIAIILVSIMPAIIEIIKKRRSLKKQKSC